MTTKRKKSFKASRIILVAAVIAVILSITAMAYFGAGNWFTSFFAERSGGKLSAGQQQYIEEKTVGIGQSKTCDGWTVTVESAICDKNHTYIKVNIVAPEGTVLDGSTYTFESDSLSSVVPSDKSKHTTIYSSKGWKLLDDGDGKSNTISLMRSSEKDVTAESSFSYTDGADRILRLENFCVWQDGGTVVLAEGVWSFEFVLTKSAEDETDEIELISKPVHCHGRRGGGTYEDVWMTSFKLSALGASCTYEFWDDGGVPEALDFIGTEVVMKDGSVMELSPESGSINTGGIGRFRFKFDAPVVLDDVDYILLPDDVTIPATDLKD